ncbi:MAG: beta-ketoacyl-[acyl-carrier-protein] synthase family protein [Vicinamibacteria bacterium]
MPHRVVVSGLGVISPIGEGHERFWQSLLSGRSGVSAVASFDTSQFATHLASEIKDFEPSRHVRRVDPSDMGRTGQLAVAAARLAATDAGLDPAAVARGRCGVAVGTTMGEQRVLEDLLAEGGREAEFPKFAHHRLATHVMAELGIEAGPCLVFETACASGNYALGYAYDQIVLGKADVMVAGGAEAFSRIAFTGFSRLGAIAPEMCQPFDAHRKGAIFGEGAGLLVLEAEGHARARGAAVLAELAGYGVSCDAFHLTAPHPSGAGALAVMEKALGHAGIAAHDLSHVNAHGTGTVANDRSEALAIARLLGDRARRVPVTSVKSSIGHTMGAASAIEAVASVLSLRAGVVPPTLHHYETDPACGIDVVGREPREAPLDVVLNNSFGFGGNNCSTVFRRWTH